MVKKIATDYTELHGFLNFLCETL